MFHLAYALGSRGESTNGFNIQSLIPLLILFGIIALVIYLYKKRKSSRQPLQEIPDGSNVARVPIGCKIVAWFYIIGSFLAASQYWTKPGKEMIMRLIVILVAFLIIIAAIGILKGKKIALVALSIILVLAFIGVIITSIFVGGTVPFKLIIILLIFYGAPAIYLSSQIKKFTEIEQSRNRQM